MDYVYEGGKTNINPRFDGEWPTGNESKTAPLMVKLTLATEDGSDADSDYDVVNHAASYKELQSAFQPGYNTTVGDYKLIFVALVVSTVVLSSKFRKR
jgi:hypothetical protein